MSYAIRKFEGTSLNSYAVFKREDVEHLRGGGVVYASQAQPIAFGYTWQEARAHADRLEASDFRKAHRASLEQGVSDEFEQEEMSRLLAEQKRTHEKRVDDWMSWCERELTRPVTREEAEAQVAEIEAKERKSLEDQLALCRYLEEKYLEVEEAVEAIPNGGLWNRLRRLGTYFWKMSHLFSDLRED